MVNGMLLEAGTFDITTSLSTATTVITTVLKWVSDNPVLTACFVLGTLVPAGIAAFSHLKSAAR